MIDFRLKTRYIYYEMSVQRTGQEKSAKTLRRAKSTVRAIDQNGKSTLPLPLDEIFEDIPLSNASYLNVAPPDRDSFKLPLTREEVLIGRDERCAVSLQLENISRLHARIVCKNEEHVIEDLDSTNGTFVNGVRVSRCILRNNDHIRIGETRIQFIQQKIRDPL